MSTSAIADTSTKEKIEKSERPLWHHYCNCQKEMPGGKKYSRCGVILAGRDRTRSSVQPVDTCVLCIDQEESNTPCKHCGQPPFPAKP